MPKFIKELEILEPEELQCDVCGENLLEDPEKANIVFIENYERNHIENVYVVCKGNCDCQVKPPARSGQIDTWIDLRDFFNPLIYLRKLLALINKMQEIPGFMSDQAQKRVIDILISTYPYIARKVSDEEISRDSILANLPF